MLERRLVKDVIYDPPESPAHLPTSSAQFWLDQIKQFAHQINSMTLEAFLALGELDETPEEEE